jgi:hypothetical protein
VVLHTDLSNAACAQCGTPEPFALLSEHRLDRKLKWCNGCSLSTLYCSKECQRKHWKVHKPACNGVNRMLLLRGVAGTELSRVPSPHDGASLQILRRVPPPHGGASLID